VSTSGTYAFAPSGGDLILGSFGLIQVRRWELTQQHLIDAYLHSNLQMVDFSNRNPNTWASEIQPIALTEGVPTYSLADRTIAVAICYLDTENSAQQTNSRVLGPLSGNDYAALPWKMQQGFPTSYYFNLLTPTPTITFWPTPDGNGPYTAQVRTFRQMQDVVLPGGVQIDSPYRFLDAFTTGLAWRLSRVYPPKDPNTRDKLKAEYGEAFKLAAERDQESTPMYVRPDFSGYFR
jgi:hypothetical protein